MYDSVLNYWLLVIPFGLSLAVDLFITTLSRFRDEHLNTRSWAIPLGLTHSLGPAFSFLLFWAIGEQFPGLHSWLALFGALLIFLVVYEIVHEEMGISVFSLSEVLSSLLPTSKESTRHFLIVMSVSWDALLCTPALMPLAMKNNWGLTGLVGAFVIFGLMAGMTAYFTLKVTARWRKQHFSNVTQLVHYKVFGSFLALSVISGFGFMALCSAMGKDCGLFIAIVSGAALMSLVFVANRKLLYQQARLEALESISGNVDQL